jgi:hypothetical protein
MKMKNIVKSATLLFIAILLISCGGKQPPQHPYTKIILSSNSFGRVDNPEIITIDQSKSVILPYEKWNDKLKDVKYIPLISKEPIGDLRQMIIYKDYIYILDDRISEKIFIFNMQGEQINIIDCKGPGPNEYRGLADMSISKKENCLVINDRLSLHLLYFSLDGTFLKKTRSIYPCYFETMNGKIFNQPSFGQPLDDGINYHLIVSVNDSIERKGFPFSPIHNNLTIYSKSLYYNYKDELLFSPVVSDTIYQIINDSLYKVKYVVKQKKSVWKRHGEALTGDDYSRLVKNSDYTYLAKPILETEKFVYYPLTAKIKDITSDEMFVYNYNYWFDKEKGVSFTFEDYFESLKLSIFKDIYHIIPAPLTFYGNYYAGIINPVVIEGEKKNFKLEQYNAIFKNEELKKMIADDNPDLEGILVLYDFKSSDE